MAIELPATVIYAYPQGGSPYAYGVGETVDPFLDGMLVAQNMYQNASALLYNGRGVWDAFRTGNTLKVMEECFKGLSGKNKAQVEQQLRYHCEGGLALYSANAAAPLPKRYVLVGHGPSDAVDWDVQTEYGFQIAGIRELPLSVPYRANSVDFYGTLMMPLAAIGYWIFGGGKPRNVHIESLNLQMVARDFQPIKALLDDPSKVGAFRINDPFSYNVFDKAPIDLPAAGMLGRISGNVQGTLEIKADGTFVFHGIYSLNPDLYDAGKSNRTWAQEALTTFLNGLGEAFGHADYYINILGTKTVQLSGTR